MIDEKMPTTLLSKGKEAWVKLSSVDFVTNNEYYSVAEFCSNLDEIAKLMKQINKDGYTILINNDTNMIIHPLYKQVNELKKANRDILQELGLTVKQREQLGLKGEGQRTVMDDFNDAVAEVFGNGRK